MWNQSASRTGNRQPVCYSGIVLYVHALVTRSPTPVSTCCPYRRSSQPAVLVLGAVHVPVKEVELTVPEVIRVHEVKLSPCVVVTLVVPLSREIQPLGVSKLVPWDTKKQSINTSYLVTLIFKKKQRKLFKTPGRINNF